LCKHTQTVLNKDCKDPITKISDISRPESFRRALVFGTSFSIFLISVISARNIWDYLITYPSSVCDAALLIFSGAGISYAVFLWFSFLLMGIKKLPGCGWTAIDVGLFNRKWHVCVDSVLNEKQDRVQRQSRISVELLKNEGSRVWGLGVIGLLVLAYFLTIDSIPPFVKLIFVGIFSSLYYLEDLTIHRFSIARTDLCGEGDFRRLMKEFFERGN
jgi:hypothetical protein